MSNQSAYWWLNNRTKTPEEEENDRRQDQAIHDACAGQLINYEFWLNNQTKTPEEEENDRIQDQAFRDAFIYSSGDYKWERRKYCVWLNDESFWRERTNPIQKLPSDIGKIIALYL